MTDSTYQEPIEISVWRNGGTSFTSQLLTLIQKADSGNREHLRRAFPMAVSILEEWEGVPYETSK